MTAVRGFSGGRPRTTTAVDDRYLFLDVRRNNQQTAGEISKRKQRITEYCERYRVLLLLGVYTKVVYLHHD